MTNKQWKPVYLRLRGDKQKSLSFRKFAEKLLAQSKERNEELGNYPNPVHTFKDSRVRIRTQALPGYDIIEIDTTSGEETEITSTRMLYSGLIESRYNAGGLSWYMRYYPAQYELDGGLGASIDGTRVDPVMPPNRWMYNDYSGDPYEATWFDQKYISGPVAGRFSGQLRKLVQLQLGVNMIVGFEYASVSHGLAVEELEGSEKRLWLYQISSGGVLKQHLFDYTQDTLEKAMKWTKGSTPPEILKNGWFAPRSEWDSSKEVMTYAQWRALPPNDTRDETQVTFQLMSGADLSYITSGYAGLGDYGWSFNSTCTQACMVGIGWNRDTGTPSTNYQSQLFIITIGDESATCAGQGKVVFVHEPSDQIKVPDSIGALSSVSLWLTESGYNASQPSSGYMAPQYAYFNLQDEMEVVYYTYIAGSTGDINGNTGTMEAAMVGCRTNTSYSASNYSYQACGNVHSGNGTEGEKHGFVTSLYGPDETASFTGWDWTWGAVVENRDLWRQSGLVSIYVSGGFYVAAMLPFATHCVSPFEGTFNYTTQSCVVIPSFERCGIYHYKDQRKIRNGKLKSPDRFVYELGAPVRKFGCKCISACSYSSCPGSTQADAAPTYEVGTYAWVSAPYIPRVTYTDYNHNCIYMGSPTPCWTDDYLTYSWDISPCVAAQDPFYEDITTYSGSLLLPDGAIHVFSEHDMTGSSRPFRPSNAEYGKQSVISAFDTFSGRYVFSMPEVWISPCVTNTEEYPDEGFSKVWVHFVGDPGFADE